MSIEPSPDIAAELGMSPSNLGHIARQHQIPLRPRGGASHAASISAASGWPQPLASAVLGQAGRQRVERFQVYARTRSINEGAPRLSTTTPVLLSQLVHLEQACGGTLIERSTSRHEAQRLSPLGERLLEQADQHLRPNPEAPAQLPEPLSLALSKLLGRRPTPPASSKPPPLLAPTSTRWTGAFEASNPPAEERSWPERAHAPRIDSPPLGGDWQHRPRNTPSIRGPRNSPSSPDPAAHRTCSARHVQAARPAIFVGAAMSDTGHLRSALLLELRA